MKTIALIDGDFILYAAGFAGQKTKMVMPREFGELEFPNITAIRDECAKVGCEVAPVYTRYKLDPDSHFFHSAKKMIERSCEVLADKYGDTVIPRVFIDGDGNFRSKLSTIRPYKGTRSIHAKPMKYNDIRQYLLDVWEAEVCHDQETDDAIAIEQTQYNSAGIFRSVIVSVDKDFLQVPGLHYNPNKGHKCISPYQGAIRQYTQCLTGDQVDNIKGCHKVGPVAAKRILGGRLSELEMWSRVKGAYAKSMTGDKDRYNGLGYIDAATENMRLVYLRRKRDELWEPPVAEDA